MKIDALDVLVPVVGPLLITPLAWGAMRVIQGGRPLAPYQKGILFYGFFFLVATLYSIMLVFRLELPQPLWLLLTVIWGAVIGKIAQRHYQRKKDQVGKGSSENQDQ